MDDDYPAKKDGKVHLNQTSVVTSNNFMVDLMANPKEFVAEVTKLDPVELRNIVGLLEALKGTSEAREAHLIDVVSNKNAEAVITGEAVVDAQTVVTNAEGAVVDAQAAVTVANQELTNANTAHAAKLGEGASAQQAHDDEIDSLNDEQQVITDVINMLEGLHPNAQCSSTASNTLRLTDSVYACEGSWSTPGIINGGLALCGNDMELCSYQKMESLSANACNAVSGFYGSSVSGPGGWQCRQNANDGGLNDVWGCGNVCSNANAGCGIMKCAIGNTDLAGWRGLTGNGGTEKNTVTHTGTNGGVLCCTA